MSVFFDRHLETTSGRTRSATRFCVNWITLITNRGITRQTHHPQSLTRRDTPHILPTLYRCSAAPASLSRRQPLTRYAKRQTAIARTASADGEGTRHHTATPPPPPPPPRHASRAPHTHTRAHAQASARAQARTHAGTRAHTHAASAAHTRARLYHQTRAASQAPKV